MLKKMLKKMTIRMKFIILLLLVWSIPVLALITVWQARFNDTVELNAINSNQQFIEKLNKHLDFYFNTVKKETFPILVHPLIQEFVQLESDQLYEYRLLTRRIPNEVYPTPYDMVAEIYGFHIVSNKGVYYSNLGTAFLPRVSEYTNLAFSGQNFYFDGATQINNEPVITVYRHIVDMNTYQISGVLVLDLRLEHIQSVIVAPDYHAEGTLMIADERGNIISHSRLDNWGDSIHPVYMDSMKASANGDVSYASQQGGKMIGMYSSSAFTGLSVIFELPLRALNAPLLPVQTLTFWVLVLLVGLSLIMMLILYKVSFRPVLDLTKIMKKVSLGNLAERAPQRHDEFGLIHQGFNHMLERINLLMRYVKESQRKEDELRLRHKEATLQSLQARINPHFLYNALEIINSYALAARIVPISQMTLMLASIFRYSAHNFDQVLPLSSEMKHVENYLTIQRHRYKDLRVELTYVSDDLRGVQAYKLIVQPIVENAFIHGYERSLRVPDFLRIEGRREKSSYLLTVVDHGGGMQTETLEAYNHAFRSVDEQGLLEERQPQFDKIGLWNVHVRLRLAFGTPYGLMIASSDGGGTAVTIRLPYFETGGNDSVQSTDS